MKYAVSIFIFVGIVAASAPAASVILNEYNAVAGSGWLDGTGGTGYDTYFGRVEGNGGDWFELVVIEDHLDMRGFQLEIWEDGARDEVLNFTDSLLWSDIRSGTIITVSEDLSDDVSYDPFSGDWWINVQASDNASGTYIEASNFKVNEVNWQLIIYDVDDQLIFGPAGEGISPDSGISDEEIFRLEANPSLLITPDSPDYDDGSNISTFGSPNQWGADNIQDFTALRIPEPFSCLLLGFGALLALRR